MDSKCQGVVVDRLTAADGRFGILGVCLLEAVFASVVPGCRTDPIAPPSLEFEAVSRIRIPEDAVLEAFEAKDGQLLLALGSRSRQYLRVLSSPDGGKSWTLRVDLRGAPSAIAFGPDGNDLHVVQFEEGRWRHSEIPFDGRRPATTSLIDTPALPLHAALVFADDGTLGFVWTDKLLGWPELIFCRSIDHGVTWSPPTRIPRRGRAREIFRPSLCSQQAKWALIWPENRDPGTLFDLYASFSENGIGWSEPVRVNDDTTEAWNWNAALAGNGRDWLAISSDYRDINRYGDLDENVYFSRISGRSGIPAPNVRVNSSTDAVQSYPSLEWDPQSGLLMAAWTSRVHPLTGRLEASFSSDLGDTWSPARPVASPGPLALSGLPVTTVSEGMFLVGWCESLGGEQLFVLHRARGRTGAFEVPEPAQRAPEAGMRASGSQSRAAEADRLEREKGAAESFTFESAGLEGWRPISGTWLVKDGTLLSFGASPNLLLREGAPYSDFLLEGRFRLDPIQHFTVLLYFRIQEVLPEGPSRGYALSSHFRYGSLLWRSDSGFVEPWRERTFPVAEAWFPFRRDVWHQFKLRVEGAELEFQVDGEMLLESGELKEYQSGSLLLGSLYYPTEFDDLRLSRLDPAQ